MQFILAPELELKREMTDGCNERKPDEHVVLNGEAQDGGIGERGAVWDAQPRVVVCERSAGLVREQGRY